MQQTAKLCIDQEYQKLEKKLNRLKTCASTLEIEKKIQEHNGFLSNLKGMVWKRSTDKDALAQLDEIHDALEPIFAKPCLAASDYATVKPLLKKAFTILHTSKDSQVVGQGMEFQKYLHKIINQNESVSTETSQFGK